MILILDIDGTLSDASHRSHYVDRPKPDWDGFLQPDLVAKDTVIEGAVNGVNYLSRLVSEVIFLTGRNESLRPVTESWIEKHFGPEVNHCWYWSLIMRQVGDNRVPTEYKAEQLEKIKRSTDEVIMCIDDDKFMMKVYREMGFITLHAPDCWKTLYPNFDHLTNETTWRK
jgi:hypothetical protein